MSEWELAAAIAADNERSLQRLIRAIALSSNHFSLILVRCNYGRLRQKMSNNLRDRAAHLNIQELFLDPAITALHTTIARELNLGNRANATPLPDALMVFGLESVIALDDIITGINQTRDIYSSNFEFPLVLWLNDEVAACLSRLAPDFKSWGATTIKFELTVPDLIALVRQETDSLFNKVLAAGAQKFLSNAAVKLDPKSQQRREIETARNDLHRLHGITLELGLEASLQFVLGRDDYVNDQIDAALTHYEQSLNIWDVILQSYQQQLHGNGNSMIHNQALIKKALVLFHLGLCYERLADLYTAASRRYCHDAIKFFHQCLEVFNRAQRQDLVAKFISPACEMLYRLEEWQPLQTLAQTSLQLHEVHGSKGQIAQDYGFLAAVAVSEANWVRSHQLAKIALNMAEDESELSRQHESWFLLLLARSLSQLGAHEEAINHLEWAKVVCELQYEPRLYLEILQELRQLYYFQQHDYLEAFHLKQEKIQIEHQYGYRAFIGPGQLQPQRYRINSNIEQISDKFEEVAQEIAASGRQQDVRRLINRITRADYKLTVIYGPSGVGKSSILKAGLVPALRNKALGDRRAFPVVLCVYTDWIRSLGRNLSHPLHEGEPNIGIDISTATIISKLRLLSQKNYTVVLIFDQFEEFFFVNTHTRDRQIFYRFLSECLNIPFVKVILSVREDYLHYLLECERLGQSDREPSYDLGIINNNILDKDIRYYLGNFSHKDAVGIIQSLTKRSHTELSDELIKQLVQDLGGDSKEVHPIELQIVGAQLHAENITNIAQYQLCGGAKKLVERWLEEVIKDCGIENEQLGWQLLFELTDEKGTRPLKTKTELMDIILTDIELAASSWDLELILEILVGSGLVLRVWEDLGDTYQLVHDYLVQPIRKKNNYGIVAELEKVRAQKTKAEAAQKVSQEQLNFFLKRRLREARFVGAALSLLTVTVALLWWNAEYQKRAAQQQTLRAERGEINLEISSITAASEALFNSNKEFDATLESLRAWRKLKLAKGVEPDTRMRVVTALQQAVYGVTEMNRFEGHGEIVWDVAFSPDGRQIVSSSQDKTIKIWQGDGRLLQTLRGHKDSVSSFTFNPQGNLLASSSFDKNVKLWRKNATGSRFDPKPYKTLKGHRERVYSANFSPNGQFLVTASRDKTVKLWRIDGSLVTTLTGHLGEVNYAKFSPDGQLIATASDDKTVKVWRIDGSLVTTLKGHQKQVTFVGFSPDGKLLLSASADKTIKMWSRGEIQPKEQFIPDKTLVGHSSKVWSFSFSPDGQQIASASDDNTVKLWTRGGKLLKTFKGHSDSVTSVSFSPDRKFLATASYDKTVRLWSLKPPQMPTLRGHADRLYNVAWSPNGQMLASASRDKTVRLWQRHGKLLKMLTGHTDRVTSVSFHPQGQMLASSSFDGTVKLWRPDGQLLRTLRGHNDSVESVMFSPDGQLLASASKDKTVKLWDMGGNLRKTLVGHRGWVNQVAFSPDGQTIATGSDDQTVKLWHRDGSLLQTLSPHEGWVLGVSFSPTEPQLIASASWDNTIKLWRKDGLLLQTLLKGYSDSVNAVTFSPDGQTIAAAGWDSTVKLWSRDGKLLKTLNGHDGPVLGVSFSPDGRTLASASADGTVILWNLNLDDLLIHGCNWVGNYLKYNRNVDARDRSLCDGIPPL